MYHVAYGIMMTTKWNELKTTLAFKSNADGLSISSIVDDVVVDETANRINSLYVLHQQSNDLCH